MKVDFISKQAWGNYTPKSIAAFEKSGLADKLWVFNRKPVKKNPLVYFFTYKLRHILFKATLRLEKGSIPNHTTLHLRNQFDALLQQKKYDYIIISYAYWADLIKDNPFLSGAVTIIDTHDLLTSQHQQDKGFDRGVAMADELRRIAQFQQVWAISVEEAYFFRQFFKERVHHIPMAMDDPLRAADGTNTKEFDLIYVATDNPHNLASSKWFFEQVYPLLSPSLKICVIGTILEHIPVLPNITGLPYADDLAQYYRKAKVAICPMLSGTGLKIKVVEALANGLPVVCTAAGIDGLPDKTNNGCLVANDPASFAGNIALLLEDAQLYKKQSDAGRDCFKRNFDTGEVYKKIDTALNITANA